MLGGQPNHGWQRGVGLQTLWQFKLKYLPIDEMVEA